MLLKKNTIARHLNLLCKSALLLGVCVFFWCEWQANTRIEQVWQAFKQQSGQADWRWLFATILLMPLNGLMEVQKWLAPVRRYEHIRYRDAIRAVLAGNALAVFSPNRLGEYGGRVLWVQSANQWKSFMAHAMGGFAQMIVLITFGTVGALWYWQQVWTVDATWFCLIGIAAVGVSVGMLLIYFNIRTLAPLVQRLSWPRSIKRYVKDVRVLAEFCREDLWLILGWSTLRYIVSCLQYYFLLQFFGIQVGLIAGFSGISTLFLIQTCLPLPPVASFFARSNIAILVWSTFDANECSSLATTALLWIINIFLPALMGTFFILHVNISKSLGYENE
jgi:hypothetical protein